MRNYKLFSLFGIDLELHWSFVLFLLMILLLDWSFMLLLLFVFLFVTLHEFSHSLVAVRRGISVKKIILLPIGGMAVMDITDINPKDEFVMAVAGPAFNFVMMALFYVIAAASGMPLMQWLDSFFSGSVPDLSLIEFTVFYAFWANFILGFFNLVIPAFPLDGGRVLRAVLAMKVGVLRATRIARNISIFLSMLMVIVGFIAGNIWLIIIGIFVMLGASAEYQSLSVLKLLRRYKAGDFVTNMFLVVDSEEPVLELVRKMMRYNATSALVHAKGRGVRVTGLAHVSEVPKTEWPNTPARKVSVYVPPASPASSLDTILKRMNKYNVTIIPVVHNRKIIGVVDKLSLDRLVRLAELGI